MIQGIATLKPTETWQAARFLAHATLGYTRTDVQKVMTDGYYKWINDQFDVVKTPRLQSHWNWLKAKRDPFTTGDLYKAKRNQVVDSIWRKFFDGQDLLRQKTAYSLSQILVTSAEADFAAWQQFTAAHYMDILDDGAFGTYRALLKRITLSPMMSFYLTYMGSRAAGLAGAESQPDENYARELLQLFTIGLVQLNMDGTPTTNPETPTYTQDDVQSLAKVFTGWELDKSYGADMRYYGNKNLINVRQYFDGGAKPVSFLSAPYGISGPRAIDNVDSLFLGLERNPSMAPFIAKQLIKRFVTSNPSTAYVGRVAAAFANSNAFPPRDGHVPNTIGDMRSVLLAILLDDDLFTPPIVTPPTPPLRTVGVSSDSFGKLREPVARFVHWGKVFGFRSKSKEWWIDGREGDLGQTPMRSTSVFNFYRPGYIPPGTDMADRGLTAPEFQITHETSVIKYINFMHKVIDEGIGQKAGVATIDCVADYQPYINLSTADLLTELNLLLAYDRLSDNTKTKILGTLNDMPAGTDKQRKDRVRMAALLIVCSPEFLTVN